MPHPDPTPSFSGPPLCAMEAHEVVAMLRAGEVSPGELLDACFERIGQVEGAVNATPTLCEDRARAAAAGLPQSRTGEAGWLAGLPIAIKDLSQVAGVRTTFGTPSKADFVPTGSDPIVARLEANGAIVVGKTNTPELGAGANTFNEVFGRTRNPWNTAKNAGGSSGGAAVSLATGEVWLSHGSDLAGSLRTPAGYCGVVGLRPSPGRVPAGGAIAFSTEGVQGPMARTVRDCALFLDAMAGFDANDPLSQPAPATSYFEASGRPLTKARIAWAGDLGGFAPVEAGMRELLEAALARFEAAGATVEEACPAIPDLDKIYRTLRAMVWAATAGRESQSMQAGFKATLADNIAYGQKLAIEDVYDAQRGRTVLFQNVQALFDRFDAIALPVVGLNAGDVEEEFPRTVAGEPCGDYLDWLKFSFLATTTGHPAIVVPAGLTDEGTPVGIQLVGPNRDEGKLLQVARAFELASGFPATPIDPRT